MGRRLAYLPGEVSRIRYGDEFQSNNPRSDVWLNLEKSADVIVPRQIYMSWKGLNIKEDEEFERFKGYAKTAENFIRRL